MSNSDLRKKYGDRAYDAGLASQPRTFERRLAMRDSLDQHFTRLWLDYAVTGVGTRPGLDSRTRFLVLTGQFTMGKAHGWLEDNVRAALAAGVKPREILETILQCAIYGGQITVDPAIEVFHKVAVELNLLEDIRKSQLPLNGNDSNRSYEEESKTWDPADVADPRFAEVIRRHGWLGVGRGLSLRPRNHLAVVFNYDKLDPEWTQIWEAFCYQGMYTRAIVDDKTRLLCMVGNCAAISEEVNATAHMRAAMEQGATPREVLEVLFLTTVNFGMPPALLAVDNFLQLLEQQGRLHEVGNPLTRARMK
jgi:alkylhydroperoxidase/carboxymuconolactone decarboxylase family protein YurZ